eukprot:2026995-Rhodomonas_salina.1
MMRACQSLCACVRACTCARVRMHVHTCANVSTTPSLSTCSSRALHVFIAPSRRSGAVDAGAACAEAQ